MIDSPLILASTSPTRRALLLNAGLRFDCVAAMVDEEMIRESMVAEGADPRDIADALAEAKARKVSQKMPGATVLGADQTLGFERETLAKSPDRDAAARLLARLRGQRHHLHSAAVIYRDGKPLWRHVGTVRLHMRDFSDRFLAGYLDRNWPAVSGAVGAYHLEGEGIRLFSKVEGDYFNVLGLPLMEVLAYLTLTGVIER